MDILKDQAAAGAGVLVVLHDLSLAARYCDALVVLQNGSVLAEGIPDDVLTDDILARAFRIRAARWQDGEASLLTPISGLEP